MKSARLTALFLLLAFPTFNRSISISPTSRWTGHSASYADPQARVKILDVYKDLPLSFEANHGQADGRVLFLSRTSDFTLFLTADEAVLAVHNMSNAARALDRIEKLQSSVGKALLDAKPVASDVLRVRLRNANPGLRVVGTDELPGTSNYFIGNDPAKWKNNVPTYAKVKYENVYPGIDLVYYGNHKQLEYDFILSPGADPRSIVLDASGPQRVEMDRNGDVVFKMDGNKIRWHKPIAYQEKNGSRLEIAARYMITNENLVSFEIGDYDATRPLYIDPLIYSTYLGGKGGDSAQSIAVDTSGNVYLTGVTASINFPTMNPIQPTNGGALDAFITKINSAGTALVYSTYLGGSGLDSGQSIAVDGQGNAYVTGYTYSTNFPVVNALQPAFAGGNSDAFVAKINPAGSALVYSTYLGGRNDDIGSGIAVDRTGNAYVTGQTISSNFPTVNPIQSAFGGGNGDAFVAKINSSGSALVYSTYLGGGEQDFGVGIAVDGSGNAFIAGATLSTNFPTMNPFQAHLRGSQNTFVTKVNPQGSALVYSTYLGGSGSDTGVAIALDNKDNAHVAGATTSSDFPIKNALQRTFGGGTDAFVSEFNSAGSALVYSTYLGSTGFDEALAIALDHAGNTYIAGETTSTKFPVTPGGFQRICNTCAKGVGFVTELSPNGSALIYSTFLGGTLSSNGTPSNEPTGIAVDSLGGIYVTGFTDTTDFPTKNALQPSLAGNYDAFLTKFSYTPSVTKLTSSPNPSVSGQRVTFTATVSGSSGKGTPTGKVNFLNGKTFLATRTLNNGTAVLTWSTLPVGTDRITAVYGGDSNFSSSTSAPVNQVVNP